MKTNILIGIAGIGIGALFVFLIMNMSNQKKVDSTQSHQTPTPAANSMQHAMDSMTTGLEGKTGDEFDRSFIKEMILHHEGAVEMAKQAKTQANHQEVKKMADDIISAQTSEIDQMKTWQKDWGYEK